MYRCIMYNKIHKHYIKFMKNYKFTYLNGIFIIKLEHIQLMSTLIIIYAITFDQIINKIK